MRALFGVFAIFVLAADGPAFAQKAAPGETCGEVVTIETHGKTKTRYSLARPPSSVQATYAVVLLPGGGGTLNLDDRGCARDLTGNSLVRSRPHFHAAGVVTALVDAPSDHRTGDGLGGFRITAAHADDLGKVIADVRARTGLPVWLIGTSRGSISAANAASRLTGGALPDGLVLTSPVTSGRAGGRKAWVVQTVFDARLESIRLPVLVVAHAADSCIRTPPDRIGRIVARTSGVREQAVTVAAGSRRRGAPSVDACSGSTPHGFAGQEEAVTSGLVRFMQGKSY